MTFSHSCSIEILGGYILIKCAHEKCAQEIAQYFSPHICTRLVTPDVVVECDWEKASRYLFRARPADAPPRLDGVHVTTLYGRREPWLSSYPPLPPLTLPPFAGRFLALHGAALVSPGGGALLILGERGAGKTTLAADLVNSGGYALLTDETAFIHMRTLLVEPFGIPLGFLGSVVDGPKSLVPAIEAVRMIAKRPAWVTQVVILERGQVNEPRLTALSGPEVLRSMLPHHLDASAGQDEALLTLARLAFQAETYRFTHAGYEHLPALRPMLEAKGPLPK